MAKSDSGNVEGYAIGDQTRAAQIKAALDRAAATDTKVSGDRHQTQGDTFGRGTGRGGCSK